MIELEKTYLLKEIPQGLVASESVELVDRYIPSDSLHPVIRIRMNGERYEITKKQPIQNDPSMQTEDTISLTKAEYSALMSVPAKEVRKIRYLFSYGKNIAEIDVFTDALAGLILADFEFNTEKEKNSFEMPAWCLVEVTDEEFIAGGMLCGKSLGDIEQELVKFGYKPLYL